MLRRLFPSRTIAIYMGRMFLLRTLAFLSGLVVILMTLDLLGESGRILAVPGNGEAELWRYVSMRVPQIIALFLPFSVLLGTLLTFMTLNQNSEITILRAAGISAHQILAPFVLTGILIAVVNFGFNERFLVRANAGLDSWKGAGYQRVVAEKARVGSIWVRVGDDLWSASSTTGTGAQTILHGVSIYRLHDDRLTELFEAATAVPQQGHWLLRDATRFSVATGRVAASPVLSFASAARPQQFTTQTVVADHLPFWRLIPAIRTMEAAGKPTDQLVAELNHKISGPLSAALMPLLGSVAAFGLARSGRLFLRVIIGLALGFTFFVADNFAMAMADFGTYPPVVAAWAPFLLFFLVGESLLFRSEE